MGGFRIIRSAAALFFFLLMFSLASCHTSRKAVPDKPHHPEVTEVHTGKVGKLQKKIIEEAESWIGTPYVYAKADKGVGTDCSGMVMKVYETVTNRKLPRNSARQAEFCIPLAAEEVATGDLIFFATGKDPERVSHVGIVVDNKSFIHASSSKGVVISDFTTPYYQKHFMMFGRVPEDKKD